MKRTIIILAMISILLSGCAQNSMPQTEQPSVPSISKEDAQQIALDKIPGATTDNIRKLETDYDNGRLIYDGKVYFEKREYDFEIDAQDGTILEWDVAPIYDEIL